MTMRSMVILRPQAEGSPTARSLPVEIPRCARDDRTYEHEHRRFPRHGVPRVAAAALGDAYLPLAAFLFVLLFPFYWMAMTSFKPDAELISRRESLLDPSSDLRALREAAVHTLSRLDVEHHHRVGRRDLRLARRERVGRLRDRAAAFPRLEGHRMAIFLAYLVPPSILFIRSPRCVQDGLFDTRWALILTYPTFLIPFCTWLLNGLFPLDPHELEECALIDGATRWQILTKIILPLAVPGLISAGIFAFTLSWNEFIYALTFVSSSETKTVAGGRVTDSSKATSTTGRR